MRGRGAPLPISAVRGFHTPQGAVPASQGRLRYPCGQMPARLSQSIAKWSRAQPVPARTCQPSRAATDPPRAMLCVARLVTRCAAVVQQASTRWTTGPRPLPPDRPGIAGLGPGGGCRAPGLFHTATGACGARGPQHAVHRPHGREDMGGRVRCLPRTLSSPSRWRRSSMTVKRRIPARPTMRRVHKAWSTVRRNIALPRVRFGGRNPATCIYRSRSCGRGRMTCPGR